jgi:hypothetical protein
MNRLTLAALLMCSLHASSSSAQSGNARDAIPSDPIAPVTRHGVTNAIVLQNRQLEVTILPSIGRIAGLRFGSLDNVLRFDADLAARTAGQPAEEDQWRNFGGDWLWPVSQAHWTAAFGRHWPPRLFIDGLPWSARAWTSDDGARTCLLRLDIGDPLFVTVSRTIRLDPEQPILTIRQRVERTAPSALPMTLWNISQVAAARKVVFPVEENSRFPGGFGILDFGPPASNIVDRCAGGLVAMDVMAGTEHKLGSDSPRGWIAAQREGVLIVERAESRAPGGDFPDGGSRIEVYANSGLGYTEIETLSEERVLAPGESLENTLTISLHRAAPDLSNCELAARIRELIGETPPARPAPP